MRVKLINKQLDDIIKKGSSYQMSIGHTKHIPTLQPQPKIGNKKTIYPKNIVDALGILSNQYQHQFIKLSQQNQQFQTDYKNAMIHNTPHNIAIQIDMPALPDQFLQIIKEQSPLVLAQVLRGRIFEIQNSLAMYGMLSKMFQRQQQKDKFLPSFFGINFRSMLNEIRQKTNKKIILLAVTKIKYFDMKKSQFGLQQNEQITQDIIYNISGFNNFLGPDEFRQLIKQNNNQCPYLLYVRSSDCISLLKNPILGDVYQNLLEDQNMRRIIKANSITFNLDRPRKILDHEYIPRINDTKRYLTGLNMGYQLHTGYGIHVLQNMKARDIFSQEFIRYISIQKQFKQFFNEYLLSKGCDNNLIMTGSINIDEYVRDKQDNKIFSLDFIELLKNNNIFIKDGQSCYKYISNKIQQFKGNYFNINFKKYLIKMGINNQNIRLGNIQISFINQQKTQCLLIPNNIKTKSTLRKLINNQQMYHISVDKNYIFSEIVSRQYIDYLSGKIKNIKKVSTIFNQKFISFLRQHGVLQDNIISGNVMIRAKPADGSYGCYGHIRGYIYDREFRNLLRKGLKQRGYYILQVEQQPYIVTDLNTQNKYNVIHRIFISLGRSQNGQARYKLIGGFGSLMPRNSIEAVNGRNQGGKYTVWQQVIGDEDVVMHNKITSLYGQIDSSLSSKEEHLNKFNNITNRLINNRYENQNESEEKKMQIDF